MALAWGVFAAGMVQLLFQFPFLRKIDMLAVPRVEWREPGVRKVGRLLGPAVFAASANQINALVGTILASLLTTGSIAWLYYADRLMELPVGLVAIALGTVLLPNLSRLHSANDVEGFAATLNWGIRVGVILSVPAAVALYMLATPLIATIFYHGAMTALDVGMAAAALQAFAVGLVAWVLVKVAAPGYFARQDTRTPFKFAVVSVVVNMALSLALFIPMGHVGLALATSVAAIVNAYLLIRGLVARGDLTGNRKLARALGATLVAALCMGLVLGYTVPDTEVWLAVTAMQRVGLMSASVAGGAAVYGLTLVLCGLRPADLLHRV